MAKSKWFHITDGLSLVEVGFVRFRAAWSEIIVAGCISGGEANDYGTGPT
jgi:hypothetical protein